MNKPFAEKLREDRRLVLLRLLSEQNGYAANSSILHAGLQHLGVAATRDDVLTDLSWLAEQGLVTTRAPIDNLVVAELTGRGQDVVGGQAVVPGVARPRAR